MDKLKPENIKNTAYKPSVQSDKRGGGGGGSKAENSSARFQEPPKFYNSNYLKRHEVQEVKAVVKEPLQQKASSRSGRKTDSEVIGLSTTVLKLQAELHDCKSQASQAGQASQAQSRSSKVDNKQQTQYDYRYGLLDAITSVKMSEADCADNNNNNNSNNNNSNNNNNSGGNEKPEKPAKLHDENSLYDWTDSEMFKKIKSRAEQAIKQRKVFLIRGPHPIPILTKILEDRGWIQKFESSAPMSHVNNNNMVSQSLLANVQPNLIWDCFNDFVEWDPNIAEDVYLNRLKNPSLYTSKLGMAHVLEESHWLYEEEVAEVLFPRSYNPSRELSDFVSDFKRCAALGLLKCFVNSMPSVSPLDAEELSLNHILFALKYCENRIEEIEHKDIDDYGDEQICDEEWLAFSQKCDRLMRKNNRVFVRTREPEKLQNCYAAAQMVIEKLKDIDPQFALNGEQNLWIVKPSELCCGSGIFITHDLQMILKKVKSKPKDYYVIQKYIEYPLLVKGTKFDIRQWFLVTSSFPLTIWSFKEALLRFSSKSYTTATYHEAIHLCNTAVQEKYEHERRRQRQISVPSTDRNEELSIRDQGWDCEQLNEYLKSVGYEGEPYWDKIYPKMSQAIVLTMLAAQDFMDRRTNSFELYGADFMVMEDLSVWLIEINTNPRMHPPSSKITQRLYRSVLDGLMKVIMDLPQDSETDVGNFELVYKQEIPETNQSYLGPCFFAYGKPVQLHEP